jgi:hypothetical protein
VVDEHDHLAAKFIALNGGQVANGADQVVGQFRWNVRLFRSVMHSFSPLRFDLAKQMAFAMSKTSRSQAAVSIGLLEKNLHAKLERPCGFLAPPGIPCGCLSIAIAFNVISRLN